MGRRKSSCAGQNLDDGVRNPVQEGDQKSEVEKLKNENCILEAREITTSNDVKMLLPDDVIYHILLWLPVISLLRFKSVCKSWRAFIESNDFIKHHLHHHHYDCPSLKDKNRSLLFCLPQDDPPITFLSTSVHNFEVPAVYFQLDSLDLNEDFPVCIHGIASFNGIVCLTIYRPYIQKRCICLWNPATKQSRLLPESPFSPRTGVKGCAPSMSSGFGFDVKTNDYKVVKLIIDDYPKKGKRVEVYNLSTDSWRKIDSVFPSDVIFRHNFQMPFHNGTCFCWMGSDSKYRIIFCFDFGSEMFRSIYFPDKENRQYRKNLCIIDDKIACVSSVHFESMHTEIWVFNEYGSPNESWAMLYKIYRYSGEDIITCNWLLMSGNYLFLGIREQICRYNVLTEEVKDFSMLEFQEILKDRRSLNTYFFNAPEVVQYKESLVSLGGGNNAPCQKIIKKKR